jgi:DNA mismatch repair protein MutL
MGRIQQLSAHVANQIAAGEVVERPAAVIKELIENALDAGATQIEVEFRAGGKRYMRVTDDGCGMDRDDAQLALARHATSKLRETRDLLRLGSFGFRGEALPSIASVSRFTLRTRRPEALTGTEILAEGLGEFTVKDSCGPPGTTVEVARLFHSVPARRKFLKTDRTEAAHITQLCRLFAVAHPEIGFSLIEDGNMRFRSPGGGDLTQRVREIFGRQLAEDLIPLAPSEPSEESGGIAVRGLVAKPGTGRSTRAEMFTFVNRRPVDSRVLNYALIESFHTYIPKGRYPMSFLFVDLPPAAVDVNVHPAKREVRFRDDGRVRQVVMEAILETLRAASQTVLRRAQPVEAPRPVEKPPPPMAHRPPVAPPPRPATPSPPPRPSSTLRTATPESPSDESVPAPSQPSKRDETPQTPPSAPSNPPLNAPKTPQRRLDWRFLGVAADGLGLFSTHDGFVCLHPAAARRRIVYETILEGLEAAEPSAQTLLFPENLELDPLAAEVLESHLKFFERLGFTIEPFGRHFFRLRAVPEWFGPEAATEFVRDLLGQIRERGLRPDWTEAAREAVATLATRKLVRLEAPLAENDFPRLAERLLACRQPLSDPRGRPTFFEVRRNEWTKRLGLDT